MILPKGPAAPIMTRPPMKVPMFLAKALRKAPRMRRAEPIAKHHFRPQRPLMYDAKNGVMIAGRKRLAEMRPRVLPEG